MWRQQAASASPDSDQSISDDDQDWPGNCISLAAASAQKKGGVEILSRLEPLIGAHETGTKTGVFSLEPTSLNFEDVEMPNFHDEGDSIQPSNRTISKDAGNTMLANHSDRHGAKKYSEDALPRFEFEKRDSSYSWSSVSKEAGALMHLNEHASCYSGPKKSYTVKGKGKGKPRFSFRFQSHKGLFSPSTSKDECNLSLSILEVPERLDVAELRAEENFVSELPEDIQGEEENMSEIMPPVVEALGHECSKQSMAELLDGLQGNSRLPRGNRAKNSSTKGKRLQLVVGQNTSPLGGGTVKKEGSPDLVDSSNSSSDIERSDKDVEVTSPKMKTKAIVDQFQEAFGATFLNDNRSLHTMPKPQGSGLFSKLQQVMQSEKERDSDFLQKLKSRTHQNEPSCICVKIITKYLDGKLTVCDCLFINNFESPARSETPQKMANEGTKRTIIFNPRVPNSVVGFHVELEVGNYIRVHPPWREVQVGNDKVIILATYFSNFQLTNSGFADEI